MKTVAVMVVFILIFTALAPGGSMASYDPQSGGWSKTAADTSVTGINVGIGTSSPHTRLEISNTAGFTSEYDNGNSGAARTVAWTNGNKQRITLTAAAVTITFTSPNIVGNFLLTVIQDGTGGRTISWPAGVKWPNGMVPTLSAAAGAMDVFTFYYNGTNYLGCASLNYQ